MFKLSNSIKLLPTNTDLLLIDGRFRVASCLKSYNHLKDDCLIAFDDFIQRPYYHSVLKHFKIINQGNRMVILQKLPDKPPPIELIQKYELIPN